MLPLRHTAVTSLLTAIAVTLIVARTDARPEPATVTPPLEAALTVATTLPEGARAALIDEAEGIWRDAGVHLDLTANPVPPSSPAALRIFVVEQQAAEDTPRWVAGALLRSGNDTAIAITSIARARAIVAAAGAGRAHVTPASLVHHRLGIVLGRAVAHEIGHYLLGTGEHAGVGLMRATITPREFTDLRSGAFALDKASRHRIQARFVRTTRTTG